MFFYENIFRISDNRYHCNSISHSLWSDGEQPLQLTFSAAPLLFKTKSGAADKASTNAKTVKKLHLETFWACSFLWMSSIYNTCMQIFTSSCMYGCSLSWQALLGQDRLVWMDAKTKTGFLQCFANYLPLLIHECLYQMTCFPLCGSCHSNIQILSVRLELTAHTG